MNRSMRASIVMAMLSTAAVLAVVPGARPAAAAGAARFQAVAPTRLADTRQADCTCTRVDTHTLRVQVAGRGGVPADAIAAALTVTATGTAATGYATVWPTGSARQETSTLNWDGGQTRANGSIVQLGAGGAVDVYVDGSLAAAQVIVDVSGAFTPSGINGAGQFRPLAPVRALDTRSGPRVGAGQVVRVGLPAGVPADATAIAVNVTAADSIGFGYLTAYAARAAMPSTSTVNTDGPGQNRAATAIVPVSAGGMDVYASSPTHVLVDVVGWFTGASSAASSSGLFVPVAPTRLFDTRQALAPLASGASTRLYTDSAVAASAWSQIAPAAGALVVNVTATQSVAGGYVTAFASGDALPPTSSLNWGEGETVANLSISAVSARGVAFFASTPTHLLVDVTGYFTGTPSPAPPVPAATAIQDPTVAAIVASGVTPEVQAALGNVEMKFLPDGSVGANTSCSGQVGVTTTNMWSVSGTGVWSVTTQRIALAAGLASTCAGSLRPASAGAHEAGHVLIARWRYAPRSDAEQEQRTALVSALAPGGEECLAEAVAQVMFAVKGSGPYSLGYGGAYQSCATAPTTVALAQQVLAIAG